jgi:hypothetical protein
MRWPKKEPDRHEYGGKEKPHSQHDPRLSVELSAQQVPSPRRRDAERAGQIRGQQHVGKAHPCDTIEQDRILRPE